MEIYHYVYRVENDKGEFYYGKRSYKGDYKQDKYMGSGTLLKAKMRAGKYSWVKQVVFLCEDEDEAYEKEKEILGSSWRDDEKCLNLREGGRGGGLSRPILPLSYFSEKDLYFSEKEWLYHHKKSLRVHAPISIRSLLIERGWSPSFKWGCSRTPFTPLLQEILSEITD
jgi:hypothetical protein